MTTATSRPPSPRAWTGLIAKVVRLSRLRGTKALVGFTRIDAPEWGDADSGQSAPLSNEPEAGCRRPPLTARASSSSSGPTSLLNGRRLPRRAGILAKLRDAHGRWRTDRDLDGPHEDCWPGDRYLLLHSLSHLLVREIAQECGYSSASISERIDAIKDRDETGIPLSIAASDSEGTLGGIIRLFEASQLDRLLRAAFANARRCSSEARCAQSTCHFGPRTACTARRATRACSRPRRPVSGATGSRIGASSFPWT